MSGGETSAPTQRDLAAQWLADARAWLEPELAAAFAELDHAPPRLVEAMAYATLDGGKRLRPALVRLACHWNGGNDEDARGPAIAVECIHAYSLVHDDLPCMDDDAWRRGRPSCHAAFGEALALLAADALQSLAFEYVARAPRGNVSSLVRTLASAVGARGMVGGQVLDMALTGAAASGLGEVTRMQAMKTGALIAASARLGAEAAGAPARRCDQVEAWGAALGRCFQAIDDVLDVTADRASLGKTPGKDAAQRKPTLVAALGLEGARAYAAEQAEAAQTLARDLGGPFAATALGFGALLLDRRS
ncbi:MAG: polyprenyl synthetase family protein [Planctomycetes bacterium]|nr:polyprenyl synthetase family protein [Planctomycetota bacterium]